MLRTINVDFCSYSGYIQTILSMPVILHRLTYITDKWF